MPTLPPLPKSYSAEMVRSDGDNLLLYVDGGTRRVEFFPKSGPPSVVICRADKRVMWSLSPDTKTYSQAKMPKGMERAFDPDTLYDWTADGVETIDGRRCQRYVGRYKAASGSVGEAHMVCLIDTETGMRRRVMDFDEKGQHVLTTDYLNAKVGAPPQGIFEMPVGYKRGYHQQRRIDGYPSTVCESGNRVTVANAASCGPGP